MPINICLIIFEVRMNNLIIIKVKFLMLNNNDHIGLPDYIGYKTKNG